MRKYKKTFRKMNEEESENAIERFKDELDKHRGSKTE